MTAPLDRREQANVQRLEALEAARRDGSQYVSDHALQQAREQCERDVLNAEARQRYQDRLAFEAKQQADAAEARRQEAIAAEVARYRAQARVAFPGTQAEFDAQWPAMLAEWQRRQTEDRLAQTLERKRAMYGGLV